MALPTAFGQDSLEPQTEEAAGDDAGVTLEESTSFSMSGGSSYLFSSEEAFGTPELLWPGFLTGMRATSSFQEKFIEPLGNPIYFESPFIDTQVRLFYLWHPFPKSSQLGGGRVNVGGGQIRAALTDRLALIATKDGWSDFSSGITPDGSGWNDFQIGLKYAFLVDEANEFVLTGGLRWEWTNGNLEILQGGDSHELSPFVSVAKGWDRLHFLGTINGRIATDRHDANHILSWDLHLDYEVAPETLPGFFPLVELHALHYLTNADRLPLSVGGLDYTNLGSNDVAGSSVFWGDLGFRWKLTPNLSFGAAYGFPISNPSNDIFEQRVTIDLIASF